LARDQDLGGLALESDSSFLTGWFIRCYNLARSLSFCGLGFTRDLSSTHCSFGDFHTQVIKSLQDESSPNCNKVIWGEWTLTSS
jgi:hypothetical protein